MQNTSNITYLHNNKVINIKSELLCREAEDDFYYFNKVNSAYKKLKLALDLTPNHLKSLLLYADVCFVKGMIKKALLHYKKAELLLPCNAKILASISNCNYSLGNNLEAMKYCEKALSILDNESSILYSQLMEIKISILMQERKYNQAYVAFIQIQNVLDANSLKSIYNVSYEILSEKIKLQEKLKKSKLQII